VLLDDDFSSIVAAVRLGRRIFDNLRKAVAFLISVHLPIVGLSLIPVALGWPLILMPVHILFLQLIIDPACSLVFEAEREERDIMFRPPRHRAAQLFDTATIKVSVAQGGIVLLAAWLMYALAQHFSPDVDRARAMTFVTLVAANLWLIFSSRSAGRAGLATLATPNPAFWWVNLGAIAFLVAVLSTPFLRQVFYFAPLSGSDIVACLVAGAACGIGLELTKLLRRSPPPLAE